jgi:phage terminase small subunit
VTTKPKAKLQKLKARAVPKRKTDPDGLNVRQRTFVDEYLVSLNGTQAAIKAGYAENSARVTAAQLLAKPNIAAVVARRTQERAQNTKIDQDWVLRRLDAEANADINDLYENTGHFKPVSAWPLIWRTGLVESIKMGDVEIDGKTERRPVEIKVSGRIKRVELVGKHVAVQAFRDRVDHGLTPETGKAVGEGIAAGMTAREAAEKYREKLG